MLFFSLFLKTTLLLSSVCTLLGLDFLQDVLTFCGLHSALLVQNLGDLFDVIASIVVDLSTISANITGNAKRASNFFMDMIEVLSLHSQPIAITVIDYCSLQLFVITFYFCCSSTVNL